MLSRNILFKNFNKAKISKKIKLSLKNILNVNNDLLLSFTKEYKNRYDLKKIKILRKSLETRIIGMGGSILGSKAIYSFLKDLIPKNFYFIDNLEIQIKPDKQKYFNLIILYNGKSSNRSRSNELT